MATKKRVSKKPSVKSTASVPVPIPGPPIQTDQPYSDACAGDYLKYIQLKTALDIMDADHAAATAPLRAAVEQAESAWQSCEMIV